MLVRDIVRLALLMVLVACAASLHRREWLHAQVLGRGLLPLDVNECILHLLVV